jgi:hypothetical protein
MAQQEVRPWDMEEGKLIDVDPGAREAIGGFFKRKKKRQNFIRLYMSDLTDSIEIKGLKFAPTSL